MKGPADPTLVEHVRRLRHDLGKYVSLQVRWLGDDPDPAALREALVQDLAHTRRGPDGSRTAPQVWAEFRSRLIEALPGNARVYAIESAMVQIEALLPHLGALDDAQVDAGVAAGAEVSAACRALLGELLGEG